MYINCDQDTFLRFTSLAIIAEYAPPVIQLPLLYQELFNEQDNIVN